MLTNDLARRVFADAHEQSNASPLGASVVEVFLVDVDDPDLPLALRVWTTPDSGQEFVHEWHPCSAHLAHQRPRPVRWDSAPMGGDSGEAVDPG